MGSCDAEVRALDTVRILHQTVVSLRQALEQSQVELNSLKKVSAKKNVNSAAFLGTIEKLSVENHALRRRLLSLSDGNLHASLDNSDHEADKEEESKLMDVNQSEETTSDNKNNVVEADKKADDERGSTITNVDVSVDCLESSSNEKLENNNVIKSTNESVKNENKAEEELLPIDTEEGAQKMIKTDSEDSEEVDDIELIFTTDDTKELCTLQEDMVSINETDTWPGSKNLQSVFVETDISKCGVINDSEQPTQLSRRNTVAHTFSAYRPILHREVSPGVKSQSQATSHFVKFADNLSSVRPILNENNNPTQESEAQTDISALPSHWKSESYLAHHKISHNFTTLPSKFTLPPENFPPRKQSLKLCEKTQEARRILLSDINFTSMVPELSQSFDHLCQIQEDFGISSLCKNYPRAFSFMKNTDYIMSPGYGSQNTWSPFDCSQQPSWDQCECSLMSMSPSSPLELAENRRRRHSFHPSALSLDSGWSNRQIWSSTPSSPVRCRSISLSASGSNQPVCRWVRSSSTSNHNIKRPKAFSKCRSRAALMERKFGISMPDLREPDSGGESTESLIEESEQSLRKSIDAITTGSDLLTPRSVFRRCSEPRFRFASPKKTSHRPFIVKAPYELKPNQLVKVITLEGRIINGRVKYVGPISGKTDIWIGVQTDGPIANGTDGTFNDCRYFECEKNSGVFVPFKKVVLAWTA